MRRAALLLAAALLASGPADALPMFIATPHVQAAPIELARHTRHHQRRHARASAGGEAVLGALFWPLHVATPDFDDPACAFVGCAPGWTLGPLAWGLYGVGFSDPLGLSR